MAIKADGIDIDVTCEKCNKRKAEKEYLIPEDKIIYLCDDCAMIVFSLMPFIDDEEHTG